MLSLCIFISNLKKNAFKIEHLTATPTGRFDILENKCMMYNILFLNLKISYLKNDAQSIKFNNMKRHKLAF